MIKATADRASLPLFEALASEVRLNILHLLAERPMNNKDLASRLLLSSSIITMHVRKLHAAGLIQSEMISLHGATHKLNTLATDFIEIALPHAASAPRTFHEISIPVGHFTHFEVHPTCGIATTEKVIGQYDDPRYFLDPERMYANILWFGKGFVEYKIPNYLLNSQEITEIEISLELSSEAPGINGNWPSDIRFYLNHTDLGYWTSPGDSGEGRGNYTPAWWRDDVNQYGFLKVIRINQHGTFIDGIQMSSNGLEQLPVERNYWTLRFAVEDTATHIGGLTLYGVGFGNYNQDIEFRCYYK
ncbi:MAG: ArsR family transcriptional regulator [Gorillibacterium sp.]|nr:ArsR family transcriptional regulator [Gorillibacterium sp.]